jgi:hypothetical protein
MEGSSAIQLLYCCKIKWYSCISYDCHRGIIAASFIIKEEVLESFSLKMWSISTCRPWHSLWVYCLCHCFRVLCYCWVVGCRYLGRGERFIRMKITPVRCRSFLLMFRRKQEQVEWQSLHLVLSKQQGTGSYYWDRCGNQGLDIGATRERVESLGKRGEGLGDRGMEVGVWRDV